MTLREAFEAWMQQRWTDTPILAEENVFDSPPANLDPWISIDYEPFYEEPSSIGAGCYRVEGVIRINAWTESGSDYNQSLALIEKLRTLLRNARIAQGLRMTTAGPAEKWGESSDGNWFAFTTEINYIHDYQI